MMITKTITSESPTVKSKNKIKLNRLIAEIHVALSISSRFMR